MLRGTGIFVEYVILALAACFHIISGYILYWDPFRIWNILYILSTPEKDLMARENMLWYVVYSLRNGYMLKAEIRHLAKSHIDVFVWTLGW